MKIYLVGGAVRDKLLGLPIKEKDWVVVGATVADMLKLGYKQVGKEFPVFLHPKTNEEYALARMERKVKPGYKGFEFDTSPKVTLEEDLQRRDLTINAMAESPEGALIDPYHGKKDLENRVFRHVSPSFSEDPVRILRVGRFLARYAYLGFKLAPETVALMQQMVAQGEVDALVAERVWKELERALAEKNPEMFFVVMEKSHALPILFPAIQLKSPGMQAMLAAAMLTSNATVRLAALLHAVDFSAIKDLCHRYKLPNAYRELSVLTASHYQAALQASQLSVEELLNLFSKLDVYRRWDRFLLFLMTCQAIADAQHSNFPRVALEDIAQHAKSVSVQDLLEQGLEGQQLAQALNEKRKLIIQKHLSILRA